MLLDVTRLSVSLKDSAVPLLRDISFQVPENHCLGILGESGSGKSLCWKAILRMLDRRFSLSGGVQFRQRDILSPTPRDARRLIGRDISVILQNAMTAFDPLFSIGNQMSETFRASQKISKQEARSLSLDILEKMKIESPSLVLGKYPHELSGGMLQRIMIGIAMALNPSLIIADEPTTAIDSINQTVVLEEFRRIKKNQRQSMIFITHDLGVMSRIADSVLVLSEGAAVECGPVENILRDPQHAATQHLVRNRMKLLDQFQKHTKRELLCC